MAGSTSENWGTQNLVVFRINFQENSEEPLGVQEIVNLIHEINQYYNEISYEKMNFASFDPERDIFGTFTFDVDNLENECKAVNRNFILNISSCLNGEACSITPNPLDLGITLEQMQQYDRALILFPKQEACDYNGWSTIGKAYLGDIHISSASLNGPTGWDPGTTAHELGHQFGLSHAGDLECGTLMGNERGSSHQSCTGNYVTGIINESVIEYGDYLSIMARPNSQILEETISMNLPHRYKAGWLNQEDTILVDSSMLIGAPYLVYDIISLSKNEVDGLKGIKVKRGASLTTDVYYIEYRTPENFDSELYDDENIKGVFIRLTQSTPFDTRLIDTSPTIDESDDEQILDSLDGSLKVGKSMTLYNAQQTKDLRISVEYITKDYARIKLYRGNSPETPQCSDGIDNDNDGKIDILQDLGCSSGIDTTEADCGDGFANQITESCDDGNTINTDSCNNQCQFVCVDNDGGSIYKKGTTGPDQSGVWYQDYCSTENRYDLIEYSCVNNEVTSTTYNCAYGCGNGACGYLPSGSTKGPIKSSATNPNQQNNIQ